RISLQLRTVPTPIRGLRTHMKRSAAASSSLDVSGGMGIVVTAFSILERVTKFDYQDCGHGGGDRQAQLRLAVQKKGLCEVGTARPGRSPQISVCHAFSPNMTLIGRSSLHRSGWYLQ